MADEIGRDWVDTIAKLLVPVLIAIGGIVYSVHKDKVDRERLDIERTDNRDRQQLDRDTGYVKMLVSTNQKEKDLGLAIIEALSKEHKFSPDLVAVVSAVAGGRPGDDSTQTANRILTNAGAQDNAVGAQIARAAAILPIQVYIQISKEDQRSDASVLQGALRQAGFVTPDMQLVTGEIATVHTYVRFFSAASAAKAGNVNDVMHKLGYPSEVQDFSNYTQTPLPSIEVWIGKNQGKLPSAPGS